MSVATALGVGSTDSPTMKAARARWHTWTVLEPALTVVEELADLPAWTRTKNDAVDDALRALARIGSPTGTDDSVATTVLCWLLLPGAVSIAYSYRDTDESIDELVASLLWSNARTHDWTKPSKVAPSVLRATRRAVQAEAGIGEGARRADRTWASTQCFEPQALLWHQFPDTDLGPGELSSIAELFDVLDAAESAGALRPIDRELLIELAVICSEISENPDVRIRHQGRAGLVASPVTRVVAQRRQRSEAAIRNRAVRALNRLSDFASNSWPETAA